MLCSSFSYTRHCNTFLVLASFIYSGWVSEVIGGIRSAAASLKNLHLVVDSGFGSLLGTVRKPPQSKSQSYPSKKIAFNLKLAATVLSIWRLMLDKTFHYFSACAEQREGILGKNIMNLPHYLLQVPGKLKSHRKYKTVVLMLLISGSF